MLCLPPVLCRFLPYTWKFCFLVRPLPLCFLWSLDCEHTNFVSEHIVGKYERFFLLFHFVFIPWSHSLLVTLLCSDVTCLREPSFSATGVSSLLANQQTERELERPACLCLYSSVPGWTCRQQEGDTEQAGGQIGNCWGTGHGVPEAWAEGKLVKTEKTWKVWPDGWAVWEFRRKVTWSWVLDHLNGQVVLGAS